MRMHLEFVLFKTELKFLKSLGNLLKIIIKKKIEKIKNIDEIITIAISVKGFNYILSVKNLMTHKIK